MPFCSLVSLVGSLSLNFGSTALLTLFRSLKTDFFITLYFNGSVEYHSKTVQNREKG